MGHEIGPAQTGNEFYTKDTEVFSRQHSEKDGSSKKVRYVESHKGGGVEIASDLLGDVDTIAKENRRSEESAGVERRANQKVAEAVALADIRLREDLAAGAKAREAVKDAARFDDHRHVSRLKTAAVNRELGNAAEYDTKVSDDLAHLKDVFQQSKRGKLMGTHSELIAADLIFGSDEYKAAREKHAARSQPTEQPQPKSGFFNKLKGIFGK